MDNDHYSPYLKIQNVPSQGLSSRVYNNDAGRIHHFLSQLESDFYRIAIFDPNIETIYEQYPLELKLTKTIANALGYLHPHVPGGKEAVITTDFVLVKKLAGDKRVQLARSVKFKEDLQDKRTREKLEIEAQYWKIKGVDWKIITEESLNQQLVKNINVLDRLKSPSAFEEELLGDFKVSFLNNGLPLPIFFKDFEEDNDLLSGTARYLYRILIKERTIEVDLRKEII